MLDLLISSAHAQAATGAPQQSPFVSFIPFVLIFLVMYFLMIRPQKKMREKEQQFLAKLNHGDEVYTKSGMLGKITGIADQVVTLETESGAKIKVLKSFIGGPVASVLTPEKK